MTIKTTKHVSFRLAEVSDAEFILSLRLDEDKNRFISKVKNDIEGQRKWIDSYKEREKKGQEYYYIIQGNESERLGVVRIYDFINDSFCWGSWILKKGAPTYAAIESALTVYEIAFYTLGFKRSHFDVRRENNKVVDFHLRFGAVETGKDELNYYFDISKEVYEQTRNKYKRFLVSMN